MTQSLAFVTMFASGGSAPAVSLSATWTTGVAPMGVFLEATATGFGVSRPLHDLRYKWTFGTDTGTWSTPARLVDGDKNVAYGPWAVHTFDTAGSYTVTCEVTDGSATVSETIDVTVQTPETYFTSSNIFVVSQDGDFTGAPVGATQYTTIADAMAANTPGAPPWPKKCILLRAGETFDASEFTAIGAGTQDGYFLGKFGSGARPVIDCSAGDLEARELYGTSGAGPAFLILADLDLQSSYRGATGSNQNAPSTLTLNNIGNIPTTVHNVRAWGGNVGLTVGNSLSFGMPKLVISEFDMSDWKAFGVTLAGIDQGGMVGCRLNMQPDASSGPGGREDLTEPDWTDHGPYRDSEMGRFTFRQCEMFSKAGWSGGGGSAGTDHQQCMRLQSEGGTGGKGMVERCVLEGGFSLMNVFANAGDKVNRPQDYIIEKNVLIGTANTQSFIDVGFGGTTIRNNIFVLPNTPHESSAFSNAFIGTPSSGGGSSTDNASVPIYVYNNTFVDLRSNANQASAAAITLTDHVSDGNQKDYTITFSNNVVHQPNLSTPNVPDDPIEEGPAIVLPLYEGEWYDGTFDGQYVTPTETVAEFKPLAGSAAIDGAGSGKVALDAFDGDLRGATAYRGAWEETGAADTDVTAPTLSSVTDTASGDFAMTGSVTIDEPGRIWWVVTSSATAPSAAQIKARTDHLGAAAAAAGVGLALSSGAVAISADGFSAATYYLHCVAEDASGNLSSVASGDGFTAADLVAPVLSGATDAKNGSSAMTGSVTTDEGNGTLYYVVTTSATSPSAAQVKAGNDHTGTAAAASGNQAVSATGSQAISASGLSAETTYYAHYMHEDSSANQSAVASADGFTTDAASFIAVGSEIHVYQPSGVTGTGAATGWTDDVGTSDASVSGSPNIDADGGVEQTSTAYLTFPDGVAPEGSRRLVTVAYAWNASATLGNMFGTSSGTFSWQDGSSTQCTFSGTGTYYVNGVSNGVTTARNTLHDNMALDEVMTVDITWSANTDGLVKQIMRPSSANAVTLYGAVIYTDPADRSTAETWAAGLIPGP